MNENPTLLQLATWISIIIASFLQHRTLRKIHEDVSGRLTAALKTIEDLKTEIVGLKAGKQPKES